MGCLSYLLRDDWQRWFQNPDSYADTELPQRRRDDRQSPMDINLRHACSKNNALQGAHYILRVANGDKRSTWSWISTGGNGFPASGLDRRG